MSITASVIVKNEMGRYLRPFIDHLESFCDDIVVLDDGSTDGTYEYLESAGIPVQALVDEDGFFAGHEGRRRQALLEMTLARRPEWILAIDADEFIASPETLTVFAEQQRQLGTLEMEEVWKAPAEFLAIRKDGGWRPHPVPIMWRPSIAPPRRLTIANRALACGREPEIVRRQWAKGRPTGTSILHFGWAREADRQARFDRYVTADGGQFHAGSHLDSIMWGDDRVTLEEQPWPAGLVHWRKAIVRAAR